MELTDRTNDFEPIDHGPRSNESQFGEIEGPPDGPAWRDKSRWRVPMRMGLVKAELLPFTVGIVETEDMLQRVQQLRALAYGHHLPEYALKFSRSDAMDRLPAMTVLYAQDKDSGRIIGTARVQTNLHGKLQIEDSLDLPAPYQGLALCEVTRLAVLPSCPYPVRLTLFKAVQLFCVANQIAGMVVGSRRSLVRQYASVGFRCLYGDNRVVPLAHGSGLDHRILFLDAVRAEGSLRTRSHPYHDFYFCIHHPDIQVFHSVLGQSSRALRAAENTFYSSKAA